MTDDLHSDPLIRLLTDLPRVTPDVARDRRVLSRCHTAIARQMRSRARAKRVRTLVGNSLDVVLASAVAFYAAVAVSEALRLTLQP
ncbi:MAG TPA: hypothetical protein VKB50_20270 [Vicinamibacterales bacterium]|nr:hypothetical protein [Vicinamibacterales bacterium]